MNVRRGLMLFCLLSLCFVSSAQAHFLWIVTQPAEQPATAEIYFGEAAEPDDPELLEKVKTAEVWLLGSGRNAKPQQVTLRKVNDALVADVPAERRGSPIVLKHSYGVIERGREKFLLNYYAKTYPSVLPGNWRAVDNVELLPLEVVPEFEGANNVTLKVYWQSKPQEGATVTVNGPGLESKLEGTTDKNGLFRCKLTAGGVFSIRARHVEEKAGEKDGKAYASIRHYSTLALRFTPVSITPASHKLPDLVKGTTSFGGAIEGDYVYVYGGYYGRAHEYYTEDQSGDFARLNLRDPQKWESLPGGPKATGLAMVAHRGKIYRIGGFTAKNAQDKPQDLWSQNDFARFDVASKKWEQLPSLPEGRSSVDAAVIGDTLYVVGGWNMQGDMETKWHDTALSMNLAADTLAWKEIAKPPFERRAMTLAAHNGKLYVLGGMQRTGGTTTTSFVFDPAGNSWSEAPTMLGNGMDGFGASAFACRGQLFVSTMSGSLQRLNATGDRFELAGQLQNPRFFHRMLPWQNNQLVIVGGAHMTTGKLPELELLPVPEASKVITAVGK